MLVFLALIMPSTVLSVYDLHRAPPGFTLLASATIFRDLAFLALVLFFAWRNGEPAARLGWRRARGSVEIAIGVALFVPISIGIAVLAFSLRSLGLSGPMTRMVSVLTPHGTLQLLLALGLVPIVAVAEETIFRGYLILRFEQLTHSRAFAIVLSAALFAVGHLYEGASGALTIGALGVALGYVYTWRRSLVAPVIIHFAQDFVAMVIAPLLVHAHP